MKKNLLRALFLSLLITIFVLIFNFSSQNGEESGSLSKMVTEKIVNTLPYIKDLDFDDKEKIIENGEIIVRKLAHLSIYTLVGMFAMAFMCTFNTKLLYKFGISFLVGLIYAITDEYHQSFVAGRGPAITDVCIDTAGVCIGIVIVLIIISIYKKLRIRKMSQKN